MHSHILVTGSSGIAAAAVRKAMTYGIAVTFIGVNAVEVSELSSETGANGLVCDLRDETAVEKVRLAEDGWNSRDPAKVALAYTEDTEWRNRAEFPRGRAEAQAFLERKGAKELDYRLIKELWAFTENRIAVRYAYEYHDDSGNWFRACFWPLSCAWRCQPSGPGWRLPKPRGRGTSCQGRAGPMAI